MPEELKIKCPACGREYLPCEVYYPDDFLGNGGEIFKDEQGKIITYSGKNMNVKETFVCDCGCEFEVTAEIKFKTEDLSSDYCFDLFSEPRTSLDEGN